MLLLHQIQKNDNLCIKEEVLKNAESHTLYIHCNDSLVHTSKVEALLSGHRLQECPLGEPPLYNNTTAETLTEYQ